MSVENKNPLYPYIAGKAYLVRTVTMYNLGVLRDATPELLIFSSGGWVPDSGRWHESLKTGKLFEFEPNPGEFFVSRASIIDVNPWEHEVPSQAI